LADIYQHADALIELGNKWVIPYQI